MNNRRLSARLSLVFAIAVSYFALDASVQATGFLTFGSWIGMKNFLPSFTGIMFGPFGTLGCGAGCLLSGALLKTAPRELLYECFCIAVLSPGAWALWHLGSSTHRVHFKKPIHLAKYTGILLLLSFLCGLASPLFLGASALGAAVAAYVSTGLLFGIPLLIIFNGIFRVQPVLPPHCSIPNDADAVVTSDPASLDLLNEQIEGLAFSGKATRKRVFEVQNCAEEVLIRIFAALPDTSVRVTLETDDTALLRFTYSGGRYDPLVLGKEEGELDAIGLKLVESRALRASCQSFRDGSNIVSIVL